LLRLIWKNLKFVDEAADAIYLNEEEISKIYKADLSNYSFLEKYRDLFVFGCFTGLRFSDFSSLQKEDVRDSYFIRSKLSQITG
jgi:integrase